MGSIKGWLSHKRTICFLVCLVGCASLATAQTCGDINVKSRGAKGDGMTDDTAVFKAMALDDDVGLIYMPAGKYRIMSSITISKPIIADPGAMFKVSTSQVLSIGSQPDHPLSQFFIGKKKY